MQGVSRRLVRLAGVLVVSSVLVTQGAFASVRRDDRGGSLNPFARVARVVVKILSEFGFPPG
jgi:hypothetical protein